MPAQNHVLRVGERPYKPEPASEKGAKNLPAEQHVLCGGAEQRKVVRLVRKRFHKRVRQPEQNLPRPFVLPLLQGGQMQRRARPAAETGNPRRYNFEDHDHEKGVGR